VTLPRLLFPDRALAPGQVLVVSPDARHYLRDVLRAREGSALIACDAGGGAWRAVVRSCGEAWEIAVVEPSTEGVRAAGDGGIVLVMALLKGDHTEWAVQKATELGVAEVRVAVCERSVPRPSAQDRERRRARLERVALEASRQCGRGTPPRVLLAPDLAQAVDGLPEGLPRYHLDEARDTPSLARLLAGSGAGGAVVATGPEGSFTEREAAALASAGFLRAGLGPRVLRAETAAMVAVAVVQAIAGDLGEGAEDGR
jgi:16S rRNA (uracil1498-N3)-methyltransferase